MVIPQRQILSWWWGFTFNENICSKTVNVEGIVKECEIVLIEFSIKTRK